MRGLRLRRRSPRWSKARALITRRSFLQIRRLCETNRRAAADSWAMAFSGRLPTAQFTIITPPAKGSPHD